MIIENCQLEINEKDGMIYIHSPKGYTLLRIGNLPTPIPAPSFHAQTLDIFYGYSCNWDGKVRVKIPLESVTSGRG